ncbi:MarR family transcriptional regulator [Haloechinothrix sp. LS1_15]|uniref:MarR family winged helix-turn-helix transcriptional regulator n=1 Tax=Haloechinothrix sp. LS1_15 TaxID=2652248 RepID=UPI0029480C60|nr:MarR family transcriptional regulator [Haloechinothrix sp. LS1_15]MDV6013662.1 MarR family transcriptional regulator [Haloechinothrix sp. LS1_15]
MTTDSAAPEQLDYLSFVEYAVGRTTEQLPSVDPTAMRLVLTLHRLTSALVYDLEATVHRPHGWSWPGFRVLFVLWLAGPMESKRIAQLSGTSRAAVSALVKPLERDGLISRTRDAQDRRAVQVTLTEAGREAMLHAFREHNARERAWAAALTETERRTLIELLDKLMTGAEAAEVRKRF